MNCNRVFSCRRSQYGMLHDPEIVCRDEIMIHSRQGDDRAAAQGDESIRPAVGDNVGHTRRNLDQVLSVGKVDDNVAPLVRRPEPEDIYPGASGKNVIAGTACKDVVSDPSVKGIVPVPSEERIDTGIA